ncbi:hypothetical protein ABPG72_003447 [Tetrahymena utriculariae]
MWRKNNVVKTNYFFDNQQNIAKEVEITQKILGDSSRIVEKFNLVYPQAYQVVQKIRQAQIQSFNQLNQQYIDQFEKSKFSLDPNNLNETILVILISHSKLSQYREQPIQIDFQVETEVLKSLVQFIQTGNCVQKNYLHLINLDINQIFQIFKDYSSILSYQILNDKKIDKNQILNQFINQIKTIINEQMINLNNQIRQRNEKILNEIKSHLLSIESIDLQVVYSNQATAKALALSKVNFYIDQIAILLQELEETINVFCQELLEQTKQFQKGKINVLQSQDTTLVQILAEQILEINILETKNQISQSNQASEFQLSNIAINNNILKQIPRELQGKINNLVQLDSSWIDLLQQYLPNNTATQYNNQKNCQQEDMFLLALLKLQEQSFYDIAKNLFQYQQFIPKMVLLGVTQQLNAQKQNLIFNVIVFNNEQNEIMIQWCGKVLNLNKIFNSYIIKYINQSLEIAQNPNNIQQQQQQQDLENLYKSLFLLLLPYFYDRDINELQISTVSQFKKQFQENLKLIINQWSEKLNQIAQIQEQAKNKQLNNFLQEQQFVEINEINYDNLDFQNNLISIERDYENKIIRWRVQLQERYKILYADEDKIIDCMDQSTINFLRDSNTVKMIEISIFLNDQMQQQKNLQEFKDYCLQVNLRFQQSIDALFLMSSDTQSNYLFYLALFLLKSYHIQEQSIITKLNQNYFNLDFKQYNQILPQFIDSLEQEIVRYNLEQEQLRIQQQQKEFDDSQNNQTFNQQPIEHTNQLQQDKQNLVRDDTKDQDNKYYQNAKWEQQQQQQQFQNDNLNNQGLQTFQDFRNDKKHYQSNAHNYSQNQQIGYHVPHLVPAGDFQYGLGVCYDHQFCQQQIVFKEANNNFQSNEISNRNNQLLSQNQQFQSQKCQNTQNYNLNKLEQEFEEQRNRQQYEQPFQIDVKQLYQINEIKKQQEDSLRKQAQKDNQLSIQNQIGQNYKESQIEDQKSQNDESEIKSQFQSQSRKSQLEYDYKQQPDTYLNQDSQNTNQNQNFQYEEKEEDQKYITENNINQSQLCNKSPLKFEYLQENFASSKRQNQYQQFSEVGDQTKGSLIQNEETATDLNQKNYQYFQQNNQQGNNLNNMQNNHSDDYEIISSYQSSSQQNSNLIFNEIDSLVIVDQKDENMEPFESNIQFQLKSNDKFLTQMFQLQDQEILFIPQENVTCEIIQKLIDDCEKKTTFIFDDKIIKFLIIQFQFKKIEKLGEINIFYEGQQEPFKQQQIGQLKIKNEQKAKYQIKQIKCRKSYENLFSKVNLNLSIAIQHFIEDKHLIGKQNEKAVNLLVSFYYVQWYFKHTNINVNNTLKLQQESKNMNQLQPLKSQGVELYTLKSSDLLTEKYIFNILNSDNNSQLLYVLFEQLDIQKIEKNKYFTNIEKIELFKTGDEKQNQINEIKQGVFQFIIQNLPLKSKNCIFSKNLLQEMLENPIKIIDCINIFCK